MPDITVVDVPTIVKYSAAQGVPDANGRTSFTFAFTVNNSNAVDVYLTPAGSLSDDSSQLLFAPDYTVKLNVAPISGGTVTITKALNAGDQITIVRNSSIARTSSYSDGSLMSASSLNNDFNNNLMIEQEINDKVESLCPHYNLTENLEPSDYVLPKLPNGCIWVKKYDGSGIIAQNVSGIITGGAVGATNVAINNVPIFADNSGNITSSGISIDLTTKNIAGANVIACNQLTANTIGRSDLPNANVFAKNITVFEQATVKQLFLPIASNITMSIGSSATLNNVTVNGSFNAPNFRPDTINAITLVAAPNITAYEQLNVSNISAIGPVNKISFLSDIDCRIINSSYVFCSGLSMITSVPGSSLRIGVTNDTGNSISTTASGHSINLAPASGGAVAIWNNTGSTATPLQLYDGAGSEYVGLKATDTMGANSSYTLTFPSTTPTVSSVLTSDTSGNLSWQPPGGGGALVGGMKAYVIFKLVLSGGSIIVQKVRAYPNDITVTRKRSGVFLINFPAGLFSQIDTLVPTTNFPTYLVNGMVTSNTKSYTVSLVQGKTFTACSVAIRVSDTGQVTDPVAGRSDYYDGEYIYLSFWEW